jgi:AAA family ATP:ADP antiporter
MNIVRRLILNGGPEDAQHAKWELLSALSLWSCLCLLIAAVVVARAAGASLFLSHFGGRELALVYVVVGLAVVAIIYGMSWATHGVRYDRVAIGTILTLGFGTTIFRLIMPSAASDDSNWVYGALYVFLETFALVTTMQVWTLANSLFSSEQAKRLYVFIATGGILGSLFGGLATRALASCLTADLLWIVVGLCPPMIVAIRVFKSQARHLRHVVVKEPAAAVLPRLTASAGCDQTVSWIRHPVLRQRRVLQLASRLSLLAFLTAFTTNLIDFYFKTSADAHFYGDTPALTQFFGSYYLMVGCLSLAMQIVLTPLIVRRASVFVGLALTPAVLSGGTMLNLLGTTLFRATILKLVDSGFAHSVQRSCTEMLYTPLPPNLTGEIKLLSEGVAGRAGLLMSGLVLWVLAPTLTTQRTLTLIAGLIACWFVALLVLKNVYRSAVTPAVPAAAPDALGRAA